MRVEPASARAGDDDVAWFEMLFAASYDELLRYAVRRVGPAAGPDVVAETFLVAWRRRDDVDHDTVRLWLFGVARRVVANADRSAHRSERLTARARSAARTGLAAGDAAPDPADAVVAQQRVLDVLARLPEDQAEALRLVAWDGFEPAEAAVIVGCSPAAFRVRLFRARRHAAQWLGADGDAGGSEPDVERARRAGPPATAAGEATP